MTTHAPIYITPTYHCNTTWRLMSPCIYRLRTTNICVRTDTHAIRGKTNLHATISCAQRLLHSPVCRLLLIRLPSVAPFPRCIHVLRQLPLHPLYFFCVDTHTHGTAHAIHTTCSVPAVFTGLLVLSLWTACMTHALGLTGIVFIGWSDSLSLT